ncbi:MAG: AAA family ATPase, partial [Verrucomicrobiae bacterium]|nr:AAA family ATPase [Verrucomicrobiae bacterium]
KAHHDVFNVLLQILDDGRVTDSHGRTVNFKNTVIIMTSNIGSEFITDDADRAERSRRVTDALKQQFRPEFLNRVDETIIFDRLGKEDLHKIVLLQIERVVSRLAKQGLTLKLSDEAATFIGNQGYDPVYGARPLKRAIQKHLLDVLSLDILDGKFVDGDTIEARMEGGRVVFVKG